VHDRYKDLAAVERDFRSMKTGFLEIRPIYVHKAERTQAHALICMLSLKIVREMEKRVVARFGTTDTDPHTVTLPDALAALSRLCLQVYPVENGVTITRLPRPDERQKNILEALISPFPSPHQIAPEVGRHACIVVLHKTFRLNHLNGDSWILRLARSARRH
jgi:hypothetical protein